MVSYSSVWLDVGLGVAEGSSSVAVLVFSSVRVSVGEGTGVSVGRGVSEGGGVTVKEGVIVNVSVGEGVNVGVKVGNRVGRILPTVGLGGTVLVAVKVGVGSTTIRALIRTNKNPKP